MAKEIVTQAVGFMRYPNATFNQDYFTVAAGIPAKAASELSDLLLHCVTVGLERMVANSGADGDEAWGLAFLAKAARAMGTAAADAYEREASACDAPPAGTAA